MNLQFSLSAFLFFLPEGVLLLSIIVLLGFGMIFGTPNKVSYHQKFYTGYDNSYFSASKLNHDQMGDPFEDTDIDEMDEVDEVYEVNYISPALQTMPVAKLSVIGLLCCLTTLINNPYSYAVGYGLKIDALGWGMSIALVIGAIACLVLSFHSYQRHGRYEFILIQLLSCIGMLSVIKSYSFLSLYLSLECQSLSFYMLATMHSRSEASAEAGLKYFILSAFSSAMLLLGMTLVYGCTGSHSYADLYCICEHFAIYESPMQIWLTLGLTCICVSLLFKLGAAPFHAWIADVYEGSATSITALFAICAKISALTAIIRLYGCQNMFFLLSSCALLSWVVGSLSALRQVKLKRLIAFSAVANGGWFLIGLTCGNITYTLIHLILYTLLSINLFSIFILPLFRSYPALNYTPRVLKAGPSAKSDILDQAASEGIKYISDLHQIYKVNPSLAFCVSLSMFSLAGIPPLAGFYSKYLLLNGLTQTEQYGILSLALAMAVISAFYYLRLVQIIYFGPYSLGEARGKAQIYNSHEPWFTYLPLPWNAICISCSSTLTLFFFLKPDYLCVILDSLSTFSS